MTVEPARRPARDRRHRRIHRAVVRAGSLASSMTGTMSTTTSASRGCGRAVQWWPAGGPPHGPRRRASATPGSSPMCERPSLIAADDRRIDVDRDHVPAVGGELRRQRQAHLARADDRDRAGRARLAGPRPDLAGRRVTALVGRQHDRAAEQRGRRGASDGSDSTGHQLHRPAFPGRGEQASRQDDCPAPVGRVDDRPATVADDAHERLELGDERFARGDPQLDDVALEGRRVAADQPRLPTCRWRGRTSGAG